LHHGKVFAEAPANRLPELDARWVLGEDVNGGARNVATPELTDARFDQGATDALFFMSCGDGYMVEKPAAPVVPAHRGADNLVSDACHST